MGVIHGHGPSAGLRAIPTRKPFVNRVCTGVFVTRLLPKTSADNIQNYVLRQTGLKLKSIKLCTKYETYSSFHIKCEKRVFSDLLNPEIWPEGTLVKPFFE
jgi:hypothetical protein